MNRLLTPGLLALIALIALVAILPLPALASCAPPCGYIVPLMDLDFPEKPLCVAELGQAPDPNLCIPLPALGESITYNGTMRWYWEITEDGIYPNDVGTDIEIVFSGTASNPKWMNFEVTPAAFTITTADLFSPDNLVTKEKPGSQTPAVWFSFDRDISITITRTGDPSDADLTRIGTKGDIQNLFMKAKSTSSGDRYKESFGVEEFRFYIADSDNFEGTPSLPAVALVMALFGAVIARRR